MGSINYINSRNFLIINNKDCILERIKAMESKALALGTQSFCKGLQLLQYYDERISIFTVMKYNELRG